MLALLEHVLGLAGFRHYAGICLFRGKSVHGSRQIEETQQTMHVRIVVVALSCFEYINGIFPLQQCWQISVRVLSIGIIF